MVIDSDSCLVPDLERLWYSRYQHLPKPRCSNRSTCRSDEAPVAATEAPAAEPFRVAVVMPSAINDLAFSQSMYDALIRVQEEMGGPDKFEIRLLREHVRCGRCRCRHP